MQDYIFLPKNSYVAPQEVVSAYEIRTNNPQSLVPPKPVTNTHCNCCLKSSDNKIVINQLTFTLQIDDTFRFETVYLCAECQTIYYQYLQKLLGRDYFKEEGRDTGTQEDSCVTSVDDVSEENQVNNNLNAIIELQEKTIKLFITYTKKLSYFLSDKKKEGDPLAKLKEEISVCLNLLIDFRKAKQNHLSGKDS